MKTTPFTDIHIALGAKMADFAGFNMPIQYPTGINQEHMIVREGVGVFDVSHMGEFWVKGEKSLDFLQYITTNDVGFKDTQIYTTMEMRMKCGIGKCGRCNIGDKFVCKDGPVFSFDQLGELPPEY